MFKQRKYKKFNYKPRFSDENAEKTKSDNNSFTSKWNRERKVNQGKGIRRFSLPMMLLFLVLLLICMYVLGEKITN